METRLSKQMQILERKKHDKKGRVPILPSKFLNEVITRSIYVIDGDFMNAINHELIFFPFSPGWILVSFTLGCTIVMNKKPGLKFKVFGKNEVGEFETIGVIKTINNLSINFQIRAGTLGDFYPLEALDDTMYSLLEKVAISTGGNALEMFEKHKNDEEWYFGVEKFEREDNYYDDKKLMGYVDFIINNVSTSIKKNIYE